jgi:septal ring factor EnvC (AmiA/AmiB activator)
MNTQTTPETDEDTNSFTAKYIAQLERERDEAREELATMTEQRDRLAEALKKVIRCHHDQPCTAIVLQQDDEIKRLREALQSITPNTEL